MKKKMVFVSLLACLAFMMGPSPAPAFEGSQPPIETTDYRPIRKEVQVTYQFKQQIKERIYHGEWINGFYYSGYLSKTKFMILDGIFKDVILYN